MPTKSGFHCVYSIHYHVVLPIKYRKALLEPPIVATLKLVTKELEDRYEFEMEEIGCDLNHIHLLASFHPKYSIGQFVRLYKSITARELFRHHPQLRKELWGGEFWSDGYYVATVGEKGNWKIVEEYVRKQGIEASHLRLF